MDIAATLPRHPTSMLSSSSSSSLATMDFLRLRDNAFAHPCLPLIRKQNTFQCRVMFVVKAALSESQSDTEEATPANHGTSNTKMGKASTRKKSSPSKKTTETQQREEADLDPEDYEWPRLVCCFGSAMNEFLPTVRVSQKRMDPDVYSDWIGRQWSPPEFARAPGGPASNVAIALARMGVRVAFMGKVGDDAYGQQMVHLMNTNGVQTRAVKIDKSFKTGYSYHRLSVENGKVVTSCVQVSAEDSMMPEELNTDVLLEAGMLHFTSSSLCTEPLRSSLLAAIDIMEKQNDRSIFFDLNLPLPLWRSQEFTLELIRDAWVKSSHVELTIHELDFLLGELYMAKKKAQIPEYFAETVEQTKKGRRNAYHYTLEDLKPLWHPGLKLLLVTDGTLRIHYYTREFHGSIHGTEDPLLSGFTCDRTGCGDAIVAAVIRKLTLRPELLSQQENFEKMLRFSMCAGVIAQWTRGAVRGFPTENAAENLAERVFVPSMV